MLANRQKVLSSLKPYHRDVFAFNFVRVFIAGRNFSITQHEMFDLCSVTIEELLETIMENKINESSLPQIGWYIAASYKAVVLKNKEYSYYGVMNSVFLSTMDDKQLKDVPGVSVIPDRKTLKKLLGDLFLPKLETKLSEKNMKILYTTVRVSDTIHYLLKNGFDQFDKRNNFYLSIKDYYDLVDKNQPESMFENYHNLTNKNQLDSAFKNVFHALAQGEDYNTAYEKYILPPERIKSAEEKGIKPLKLNLSQLSQWVSRKVHIRGNEIYEKLKIPLGDILSIKMFYDFIEHDTQTFNVYKLPEGIFTDTLYGSEALPKLECRQVPFDKSKSFYEVVKDISAKRSEWSGKENTYYFGSLEKLLRNIKSFVRRAYNPLEFMGSLKIRGKK